MLTFWYNQTLIVDSSHYLPLPQFIGTMTMQASIFAAFDSVSRHLQTYLVQHRIEIRRFSLVADKRYTSNSWKPSFRSLNFLISARHQACYEAQISTMMWKHSRASLVMHYSFLFTWIIHGWTCATWSSVCLNVVGLRTYCPILQLFRRRSMKLFLVCNCYQVTQKETVK